MTKIERAIRIVSDLREFYRKIQKLTHVTGLRHCQEGVREVDQTVRKGKRISFKREIC